MHTLIKSLVEKGYVQKVDGNTRVLKIVDEKVQMSLMGSKPAIELPLLGFIAAGAPLEPYSDPNATFFVSASLLSGKNTAYVLQVKGRSMIDDGILDGDYVVIEKISEAMASAIHERRASACCSLRRKRSVANPVAQNWAINATSSANSVRV